VEELLLRPLADAFLQVGVAVAVLAAVVAWARVRFGGRGLDVLVRHRRAAPAVGALLGVTPGCGGAILAAGLYLKGRASYGTAVAALTATMGDASFVLIAVDPQLAVVVHGLLLAVGTVTGYAVDAVGLDPRARRSAPALAAHEPVGAATAGTGLPTAAVAFSPPRAEAPPAVRPTGRQRLPLPHALLWLTALVGALLAVPAAFALFDPVSAPVRLLGVDLWLAVGVAGFAACTWLFAASGFRLRHEDDEVPAELSAALSHGAVETAFVVFWVSVAFVAFELFSAVSPWDGSSLALAGLVGVLVGAAVALIPGCGTQIAFTGLYAAGALPLPALLANAVAQDGDALLPMLAHDRRAAVVTTVLTTVPAVLVGAAALLVR